MGVLVLVEVVLFCCEDCVFLFVGGDVFEQWGRGSSEVLSSSVSVASGAGLELGAPRSVLAKFGFGV